MSAAAVAVPTSVDPQPWIDDCPGCGSAECDDWGLCDVDLTVVEPNQDVRDPALARAECAAVWGYRELYMDPDKRASLTLALSGHQANAFQAHAEAAALLADGFTFEEVAAAAGVSVALILSKFTQISSAPRGAVLQAESLLRAGGRSQHAIAAETGLSQQQVSRIGELIGAKTLGAEMVAKGRNPNAKYTEEQIALAWRMRDAKHTMREIQIALGFEDDPKANKAVILLRRNPRPVTDRELETVAS